jgi:hypothetical protein
MQAGEEDAHDGGDQSPEASRPMARRRRCIDGPGRAGPATASSAPAPPASASTPAIPSGVPIIAVAATTAITAWGMLPAVERPRRYTATVKIASRAPPPLSLNRFSAAV